MRTRNCRCGHPEKAHEHYRAGEDCSRCECPFYRRTRRIGRWWLVKPKAYPLIPV